MEDFGSQHARRWGDNLLVSLDPAWAAIIGAGVGVVGGFGLSLPDGIERRRERRESHMREDHLRLIDERGSNYSGCLKAAGDAQVALFGYYFDSNSPEGPSSDDLDRIKSADVPGPLQEILYRNSLQKLRRQHLRGVGTPIQCTVKTRQDPFEPEEGRSAVK